MTNERPRFSFADYVQAKPVVERPRRNWFTGVDLNVAPALKTAQPDTKALWARAISRFNARLVK